MLILEKLNELKKKFLEREFSNLNIPQREAVFQTNGNLLVLAGAGSGKTTVIINRIYNMIIYGDIYNNNLNFDFNLNQEIYDKISDGFQNNKKLSDFSDLLNLNPVLPENILAITFTNKASKEIKQRLANKIGSNAEKIWASTFHSMCAKILRSHAELIGYTPSFTIYDSDDQKRLIKECEKALNIDEKALAIKSCINYISNAKDNLMSSLDFKKANENNFKMTKIANIYELYEEKMKKSNAMDFDDLIFYTILLFKKNKEILNKYKNIFKYIMVDEYQDTSKSQHELIKLLAGNNGNLCVVGDDDQSIYKFRGASVKNILNFDKYFKNTKIIRLEQNYRSTKNILSAANEVIKNNNSRKIKNLWTELDEGEKIEWHIGYSEHDEASYIASQIEKKVQEGRKYSDFAVLYRMGSQSGVIEKFFARNNIPYKIIGNVRFFERKEIKDLIAYLSVVNNTKDEARLKRIINRPNRSIGERTLIAIGKTANANNTSFYEIVRTAYEHNELNRAAAKVSGFANLIESFLKKKKSGAKLSELYEFIINETGYLDFLKASEDDFEERIENIKELGSFISKFEEEKNSEATLELFLEEIALISESSVSEDEEKGYVTLMTVHASKGLEFPIVFLPGFEEGIFPGQQCIYNNDDIEEERRLAYVAITRAKEYLCILNSTSRMTFGSTSHNKPSRFISEIPSEIINITKSREWKKMPAGQHIPKSIKDIKIKSVVSARSFGMNKINNSFDLNNSNKKKYILGDVVDHNIFGHGIVTSIYNIGSDSLLEIDFEKSGKKKIPMSRL